MSTLAYKKNHAIHNRDVAIHLFKNTEYYDWVITCCFYSAINVIKYKIFPRIINGEEFRTFERYVTEYKRTLPSSPHTILHQLVNSVPEMKSIRVQYKMLFDQCHTARYTRYEATEEEAEEALMILDAIMKLCNTEKPKIKRKRK